MRSPRVLNAKLVAGGTLLLLSGVSVAQQIRESAFWTTGDKRYVEFVVTDNPIMFGGRELHVQDDLDFEDVAPAYREDRVWGSTTVVLDGVELLRAERAEIRPGRRKEDLGRYHFWVNANVFEERSSGRAQLWFGRRLDQERRGARFEVVQIGAEGSLSVDTTALAHRSSSYPLFRTLQFLNPSSISVYRFSLFNVWPNLIIPILFPWGTILIGLIATAIGLAEARKAKRRSVGLASS